MIGVPTLTNGRTISTLLALAALLFCCLAGNPASAQDPSSKKTGPASAAIRGTITTLQDNTLAGVAGISVKLSGDPINGTPLSVDTDEHGLYEFRNLAAGTYTISITVQGFKPVSKSVTLSSKQQDVEDFTLQLDVLAEKVEVKETAANISTESSAPPPAVVTVTGVQTCALPI